MEHVSGARKPHGPQVTKPAFSFNYVQSISKKPKKCYDLKGYTQMFFRHASLHNRLRKKDVCTPLVVNISVYSGHDGFRDKKPLASAITERWYMAPGVKRIEVNENGVRGTLFIPPGVVDMQDSQSTG